MPNNYPIYSWLKIILKLLAGLVLSASFLILVGWALDITALKSVRAGFPPIAPNSAICLFLSAAALLLLNSKSSENESPPSLRSWYLLFRPPTDGLKNKKLSGFIFVIAAAIFLTGFATLAEYILKYDLGIDQLVFRRATGANGLSVRMSPQSALNFVIIGLALFSAVIKTKRSKSFIQYLVIIVGIISLLSLLGYIFNLSGFYTISPYKGMAVHTSIAFISLFLSILFLNPDAGIMRIFITKTISGFIARRILAVLIVLSVFDTIVFFLKKSGFVGPFSAEIIYFSFTALSFIYLMLVGFRSLDQMQAIEIQEKISEFQIAELQKFKQAVNYASDHIIITDPEGKILYANKAAEKTTGYSQNEMLGQKPSLWSGQMQQKFYKHLWKTIKNNREIFIGEVQNKRKNSEIYSAEVRISPVLNQNKEIVYFVGIERDITEQKQVSKAKDELISLTSHQLRNPLTIVRWYSNMLLSEGADNLSVTQKEYMENIQKANKRMIDLVNTFLNVSRIEMGTMGYEKNNVDINELINFLLIEFEHEIKEKNINIAKKTEQPLIIITDAKLLQNVFQNLISNAVKYTPSQGNILIKTKKDGSNTLIEISDNGCGIPQKQQEKIFTKLFRAENACIIDPEGNGLGLYLVKLIVNQINGRVWFESKEGKGTTFYVSLPPNI